MTTLSPLCPSHSPPPSFTSEPINYTRVTDVPLASIYPQYPFSAMRRSSSAFVRRTHSSSISRQAQMLPVTPAIPPPSSSETRTPSASTPGSPGTERVKEWIDIFDGPMRPTVFVPSPSSSPQSSASIRDNDSGVSSIIFDGPARPRYIIPGAYIQPPTIPAQNQQQNRNEPGSPSATSRKDSRKGSGSDISALLSRSSLPPPRVYDGPAFEWELQTKRV